MSVPQPGTLAIVVLALLIAGSLQARQVPRLERIKDLVTVVLAKRPSARSAAPLVVDANAAFL